MMVIHRFIVTGPDPPNSDTAAAMADAVWAHASTQMGLEHATVVDTADHLDVTLFFHHSAQNSRALAEALIRVLCAESSFATQWRPAPSTLGAVIKCNRPNGEDQS